MSCKICGSSACASWMHGADERTEYEAVEAMSEREMVAEIISLRRELASLKEQPETD